MATELKFAFGGQEMGGTVEDGDSHLVKLPSILPSGAVGLSFSISAGTLAVSAGSFPADLQAHADSPFSASKTLAYFVPGGYVKLTAADGNIDYTVSG